MSPASGRSDLYLPGPDDYDLVADYLEGLARALRSGEVVRVEIERTAVQYPSPQTTFRYSITVPTKA